MNKLLQSNIPTLHKVYKELVTSPHEVIKSCLSLTEKNSHLNALVTLTDQLALTKAIESEKRFTSNKSLGLLDGVPIAIKDNYCTKEIRTTCASRMLENFVPTYNATVYDKLENSGAILIGKTNLDEFAMGSGTVDSIFGATKNIYGFNPSCPEDFYISGGSSGGSAIAVASGMCFASLGSDTGGSCRNPASYCGLIGLKPTYGLLSRHGLIPLVNSMDAPSILTRTVNDCLIVLNTIAGPDPKDSTTLKKKFTPIRLPSKICVKNLRVGIPIEYNCENLNTEVLETWKEIAKLLENNGAHVKEVSLPHTKYSIVCYSILNQCEVSSNMARYDGLKYGYRHKENAVSTEKLYALSRSLAFNNVVKSRIITGNYFLLQRNYEKYFNKALKVRRLIFNDFYNVFQDCDILLSPTTISTAPIIGDFINKTNRDQCVVQDYCTQPANLAGIPAVSVPIKLSRNQMPISLQLMGRNMSERLLLSIAKYIENNVNFPKLNITL